MSRDTCTFWKQQTLCGTSVGSSVGHGPLLDDVRALLCLPGPWRASEASPPFPHQLYTPGSAHHIHFPKWHLPIASRSVEIVSVCIFTWKPLTDNLSLCFSSLHTIPSQNQWSLKRAPPTSTPQTINTDSVWELIRNVNSGVPVYLFKSMETNNCAVPIHCEVSTIRPIVLQSWECACSCLFFCVQVLLLGEVLSLTAGELSKCLLKWIDDLQVNGKQNHKAVESPGSEARLSQNKSWRLYSWFCGPRQLLSLLCLLAKEAW